MGTAKSASERSPRTESTREKISAHPEWNTGGENRTMRELIKINIIIVMSGWFLLASAIVQYQRKIKLLN